MAYVKIPVSCKGVRTEKDVGKVLSEVMDFLSKV